MLVSYYVTDFIYKFCVVSDEMDGKSSYPMSTFKCYSMYYYIFCGYGNQWLLTVDKLNNPNKTRLAIRLLKIMYVDNQIKSEGLFTTNEISIEA